MRTMLISLLLIGSLAQYAWCVQSPDPVKIERGCGETFNCFVPEHCITSTIPLKNTMVKEVLHTYDKIIYDCPAIFRFHGYNSFWQHIYIESLWTTTKKITFFHKTPGGVVKAKFSCSKDVLASGNWKATAEYEGKTDDGKKIDVIGEIDILESESKGDLKDPLKCSFILKVKQIEKNEILRKTLNSKDLAHFELELDSGDKISTSTDTNTKQQLYGDIDTLQCDPGRFNFENTMNEKRDEVYKKVTFKPGKYFCEDYDLKPDAGIKFRMQYRDFEKDTYRKVKELKCGTSQQFMITYDDTGITDSVGKSGKLDIRCVANASYFCNYPAKSTKPLEQRPFLVNKGGIINQKTTLTCPENYPYFIIAGGKTNKNPKFECLNYGIKPFWKIEGERLTDEGPEVYCTNKMKCTEESSISESAVEEGFVGTDGLPKCYTRGELYLNSHSEANLLNEKSCSCDDDHGYYKCGDRVIDNSTKFICYYPPLHDEGKMAKAKEDMIHTGIIATASALVVVLILIAILAVLYVHRVNVRRKKLMQARKADEAAWVRWCANKIEKEKYAENKKIEEEKKINNEHASMSAPGESWNWNVMLTSWMYTAWATIAPDDTGKIDPVDDIVDGIPKRMAIDKPKDNDFEKLMNVLDVGDLKGKYGWNKNECNKTVKARYRRTCFNYLKEEAQATMVEQEEGEADAEQPQLERWASKLPDEALDEADALY